MLSSRDQPSGDAASQRYTLETLSGAGELADVDFATLLPLTKTPWFEEMKGTLLRELPNVTVDEHGEWHATHISQAAEDSSTIRLHEREDGTLSLPDEYLVSIPKHEVSSIQSTIDSDPVASGGHPSGQESVYTSAQHLDEEFFSILDRSSLLVDMALERMFPHLSEMLPELSIVPHPTASSTLIPPSGTGGSFDLSVGGGGVDTSRSTNDVETSTLTDMHQYQQNQAILPETHLLSEIEFTMAPDELIDATDIRHTVDTLPFHREGSVDFGLHSLLLAEAPQFEIDDRQLDLLLGLE